MITAKDVDNMVRWAIDTDGVKFAQEIYNRRMYTNISFVAADGDDYLTDEYTVGKFRDMQDRFIHWVANLDDKHKQKLADAINNNPTNEKE